MLKKAAIAELFDIFSQQNPEPKTELEFVNHYTLLVAIILSAQLPLNPLMILNLPEQSNYVY